MLENSNRTCVIQRGDDVEGVSDRVTHAPPQSGVPPSDPYQATHSDLADKTTDGKVWFFGKILENRFSPDGPLQFQIQWNGPYERTWAPLSRVPVEAIAKYFFTWTKKANSGL